MKTANIDTAKTTLSQLLSRVEATEEAALARNNRPVAKLVPFQPSPTTRVFGALRGTVSIGPGFFDPLPEQHLAAWELLGLAQPELRRLWLPHTRRTPQNTG